MNTFPFMCYITYDLGYPDPADGYTYTTLYNKLLTRSLMPSRTTTTHSPTQDHTLAIDLTLENCPEAPVIGWLIHLH